MHRTTRGFTLIELLVVIAIIGILSSVILSSLNNARTKGSDAAVKSELSSIKNQAALFSDDNNSSYGSDGTACNTPGSIFDSGQTNNVSAIVADAQTKAAATATCANTSSAWVVSVPLKTGDNWCVDSTGFANVTPLALTGIGSITEAVACSS